MPTDGERLWSTKRGDPIQHIARQHGFNRSSHRRPGLQTVAENRLVPEERGPYSGEYLAFTLPPDATAAGR